MTKILNVKIADDEKARIQQAAKRKGWSIALIMKSLLAAFVRGDKRVLSVIEEELAKK